MCWKWMRHKQPKATAFSHAIDGHTGDTQSSSIGPSGLFSSSNLSSEFISSSSSSLSVSIVKGILPQGPLLYNLSEIAAVTRCPNPQQIGSSSWKGVLRGSLIAIFQKPGEAGHFKKLLAHVHALHHTSLVKVVGGCTTARSVFVVYEFVHGADLQSCLRNPLAPGYTVLSTWKLRLQVAVDVAKGLEYIHRHTSLRSAHKYLTSSNIMLTNDSCNAKIALVGMAILTGEVSIKDSVGDYEVGGSSERQEADAAQGIRKLGSSRSLKIKGARGYMPPEYACFGVVSQKYDVFTFGIVLLELLKGEGVSQGGRSQPRKPSMVDEVRPIFSDRNADRGMLRLWIDQRLQDSYPVDDAVNVVRLALCCVDENPDKRPTMEMVALRMAKFLDLAKDWEKGRSTFTGTGTLIGR